MILNLDLDLLRAFLAVADCRNFTRAAERLHRVQSAVSMQVKRLEEIVGKRLFERSPRAVSLTVDGEVLLDYARRMLAINDAALAQLREPGVVGSVRLGTADTASIFLPGILARFNRAHPAVQVEVRCDRSWNLLDALEESTLDLALVTQSCGRRGGRRLRREPLVWAASRHHRVHRADPLPVALFAQGCAYRKAAMEALDASGRAWRMAYSSTSPNGIRAAVESGLAVGALAKSTLSKDMMTPTPAEGFPTLPRYEITLFGAGDADGTGRISNAASRPEGAGPAAVLAEAIAAELATVEVSA